MKKNILFWISLAAVTFAVSGCKKNGGDDDGGGTKVPSSIALYSPDDLEDIELDYTNPTKKLTFEWETGDGATYQLLFSTSSGLTNPVKKALSDSGTDKFDHTALDATMGELGIGAYRQGELYWAVEGTIGEETFRSAVRSMKLWRFMNPLVDSRDQSEYRVIKTVDKLTGDYQVWLADNIRATKYADGTELTVGTDVRFYDLEEDGISESEKTRRERAGGLYNWAAAVRNTASAISEAKVIGICPTGWHIPTLAEFQFLIDTQPDNTKPGESLKDDAGFWDGTTDFPALNSSGFSAVPAGYIWGPLINNNPVIDQPNAYFWMSTVAKEGDKIPWDPSPDLYPTTAYCYYLTPTGQEMALYIYSRDHGFSVRCVLD